MLGTVVNFRPGDRVELVRTDDRFTDLRPGDQGMVSRFDRSRDMVYVNWDNGSNLSMCLDAGDEIRVVQIGDLTTADLPATSRPTTDPALDRSDPSNADPLVVPFAAHADALVPVRVDESTVEPDDRASLAWILQRVARRALCWNCGRGISPPSVEWGGMYLPPKVRWLWEARFPELGGSGAG